VTKLGVYARGCDAHQLTPGEKLQAHHLIKGFEEQGVGPEWFPVDRAVRTV